MCAYVILLYRRFSKQYIQTLTQNITTIHSIIYIPSSKIFYLTLLSRRTTRRNTRALRRSALSNFNSQHMVSKHLAIKCS